MPRHITGYITDGICDGISRQPFNVMPNAFIAFLVFSLFLIPMMRIAKITGGPQTEHSRHTAMYELLNMLITRTQVFDALSSILPTQPPLLRDHSGVCVCTICLASASSQFHFTYERQTLPHTHAIIYRNRHIYHFIIHAYGTKVK